MEKGEIFYVHQQACRFRMDPVPRPDKTGRGSLFKKPKTTQEARWSLAVPHYVRPRRNALNLPNSYDDIFRSSWRVKTWKNKKIRRQWQKRVI
jgi:hypothetical protein